MRRQTRGAWKEFSSRRIGRIRGVQKIKLESVRRKSGGRIHLTPRVPRSGPVTTLCGQTLGEGSYAAFDSEPDCANCIRRSKDQARISGAFFAQEEGSELLRLSLEQAREKKEGAGCQSGPLGECCYFALLAKSLV